MNKIIVVSLQLVLLLSLVLGFGIGVLQAENIDPYEDGSKYAYSENVGWLNADPNNDSGVHVTGQKLTGYIWSENIGWISLSCENTDSCAVVDYGVTVKVVVISLVLHGQRMPDG